MKERIGRSAIALAACLAASIAVPCDAQVTPATLGQAEKRAVVEKAGEALLANYIYPDRAAEAKARLDAALRAGEYESVTTPDALAKKTHRRSASDHP